MAFVYFKKNLDFKQHRRFLSMKAVYFYADELRAVSIGRCYNFPMIWKIIHGTFYVVINCHISWVKYEPCHLEVRKRLLNFSILLAIDSNHFPKIVGIDVWIVVVPHLGDESIKPSGSHETIYQSYDFLLFRKIKKRSNDILWVLRKIKKEPKKSSVSPNSESSVMPISEPRHWKDVGRDLHPREASWFISIGLSFFILKLKNWTKLSHIFWSLLKAFTCESNVIWLLLLLLFYYFHVCHCLFIENKQTNNLQLLIEPQWLQIKNVIGILGATLDTVLRFAFEIPFSTSQAFSIGLL